MRYRCHRCETVHRSEPDTCTKCGSSVFTEEFATPYGEELYWASRRARWGSGVLFLRVFQVLGFALVLLGAYEMFKYAPSIPLGLTDYPVVRALVESMPLGAYGLMGAGAIVVWLSTR